MANLRNSEANLMPFEANLGTCEASSVLYEGNWGANLGAFDANLAPCEANLGAWPPSICLLHRSGPLAFAYLRCPKLLPFAYCTAHDLFHLFIASYFFSFDLPSQSTSYKSYPFRSSKFGASKAGAVIREDIISEPQVGYIFLVIFPKSTLDNCLLLQILRQNNLAGKGGGRGWAPVSSITHASLKGFPGRSP